MLKRKIKSSLFPKVILIHENIIDEVSFKKKKSPTKFNETMISTIVSIDTSRLSSSFFSQEKEEFKECEIILEKKSNSQKNFPLKTKESLDDCNCQLCNCTIF